MSIKVLTIELNGIWINNSVAQFSCKWVSGYYEKTKKKHEKHQQKKEECERRRKELFKHCEHLHCQYTLYTIFCTAYVRIGWSGYYVFWSWCVQHTWNYALDLRFARFAYKCNMIFDIVHQITEGLKFHKNRMFSLKYLEIIKYSWK